MKIRTTYMDGTYEESDSESSLGSSGLFGKNTIGVVNTVIRSGDLEDGLWMAHKYYDVGQGSQISGHSMPVANIMDGIEYLILSRNDLENVALIEVDDKKIAWRVGPGGPLINGFKFNAMADMFLFAQPEMPLNQQAVELYKVLHGEGCAPQMPRLDLETDREWDERIAASIGWDCDQLLRFVEIDRVNMMVLAEEEDGEGEIEEGIDYGTGEVLDDLSDFIDDGDSDDGYDTADDPGAPAVSMFADDASDEVLPDPANGVPLGSDGGIGDDLLSDMLDGV